MSFDDELKHRFPVAWVLVVLAKGARLDLRLLLGSLHDADEVVRAVRVGREVEDDSSEVGVDLDPTKLLEIASFLLEVLGEALQIISFEIAIFDVSPLLIGGDSTFPFFEETKEWVEFIEKRLHRYARIARTPALWIVGY